VLTAGDGTSGLYLWQAQLETGTRPTSPIITTDAPKTRAADNPKRVLGSEYRQDEGTFIFEGVVSDSGDIQCLYFMGTSSNERIAQYYSPSAGAVLNRIITNNKVFNAADIPAPAGKIKAGLSFKLGNALWSVNGSAPVSSSPTEFPAKTSLSIGGDMADLLNLNNYVGSVTLRPYALTAAQLQGETTL
jgi:hypothetical protein